MSGLKNRFPLLQLRVSKRWLLNVAQGSKTCLPKRISLLVVALRDLAPSVVSAWRQHRAPLLTMNTSRPSPPGGPSGLRWVPQWASCARPRGVPEAPNHPRRHRSLRDDDARHAGPARSRLRGRRTDPRIPPLQLLAAYTPRHHLLPHPAMWSRGEEIGTVSPREF